MFRQTRGSKWICHKYSDYCRWSTTNFFGRCPHAVTSTLSVHMHFTSCTHTKKFSFIFATNYLNGGTGPRGSLVSHRNLLRCSITVGWSCRRSHADRNQYTFMDLHTVLDILGINKHFSSAPRQQISKYFFILLFLGRDRFSTTTWQTFSASTTHTKIITRVVTS